MVAFHPSRHLILGGFHSTGFTVERKMAEIFKADDEKKPVTLSFNIITDEKGCG